MDDAAMYGHLKVVKWLHANRSEGCIEFAMDDAANCGHLEVVKWLHAHRQEGCTTKAMDWASSKGHLDVVRWLHENRKEGCTADALDSAATSGHVDVLKWLLANKAECCSANVFDIVVRMENLKLAQWLHENGYGRCTEGAFTTAARNDDVVTLKWLYRTFPRQATIVSTPTFTYLVGFYGRLRVAQWLCEIGVDIISPDTLENAFATQGRMKFVQWLVGSQPSLITPKVVQTLAKNEGIVTMRWMLEQGGGLDAETVALLVGEFGFVEVLTLQTEANRVAAMVGAVNKGQVKLLERLYKGDREKHQFIQKLIKAAIQHQQTGMIKWLRQQVVDDWSYTWVFTTKETTTKKRGHGQAFAYESQSQLFQFVSAVNDLKRSHFS